MLALTLTDTGRSPLNASSLPGVQLQRHAQLEIVSDAVALTWRCETTIERHLGAVRRTGELSRPPWARTIDVSACVCVLFALRSRACGGGLWCWLFWSGRARAVATLPNSRCSCSGRRSKVVSNG